MLSCHTVFQYFARDLILGDAIVSKSRFKRPPVRLRLAGWPYKFANRKTKTISVAKEILPFVIHCCDVGKVTAKLLYCLSVNWPKAIWYRPDGGDVCTD